MTAAYLRDTATQAGLTTVGVQVEQIGWDDRADRFVDLHDRPIDTCFKLYPWENMVREEFGERVMRDRGTRWLEPAWKLLLSNKALLAALWHLYPGHPNLLPAFLDEPRSIREWIRKPLHGREGDGMEVATADGVSLRSGSDVWGAEGYCYQEFRALPSYAGSHPVLGSWIVAGEPAGLGIRESDSLITDYYARFVPHLIDS
jgi:glutathionylspermidine synthase